jgi:uncharacterized RDD family membrane protein YckC
VARDRRVVVLEARRLPAAVDVAVGAAVVTARVGLRLALVPAQVLARTSLARAGEERLAARGRDAVERGRRALEAAAVDAAASPAAARTVDSVLAGPLPEHIARSLGEQRVVQRVAASPELDEAKRELVERALADPALEQLLHRVLSGPEVRAALRNQTTSFAEEVAGGLRARTAALDDAIGRAHEPGFAGLARRGLALVADAAAIWAIFLAAGAALALVTSLVGELRPQWLAGLLLGAAWLLTTAGYFVLFWSVTGQTPGMRLMRLRVLGPGGRPPAAGRSVVRFGGLLLAIVPLFAGFLPVLFDRRRRALQDLVAGTVVVLDEAPPPAGP